MNEKTIFAPATPIGKSSVTVIRMSGKEAVRITGEIFSRSKDREKLESPISRDGFGSHRAYHGYIFDGKELIDEVIVTVFKSPGSFTGEDVVEISSHGGPMVFSRISELLTRHGASHAEPGEFSKRAFVNGKMDLAQAEAVADLIQARSHLASQVAARQLKGELSATIENLRQELINYCSLIELELDFSEENLEIIKKDELLGKIDIIIKKVNRLVKTYGSGKLIRDGFNLAITGAPNVGKSTIFNYLLNESRAIVSHIPGTTRDYLEETLLMGGYSFNLIDTAGIRVAQNAIEKEGIRRSYDKICEADIVLNVIDLSDMPTESVRQNNKAINVFNKLDIARHRREVLENEICVSAKTGENMDKLRDAITARAATLVKEEEPGELLITGERHKACLLNTCEYLSKARNLILEGNGNELISLEIRDALGALGEIIGKTTNDDILNNIFAKFCIGK